MKRLLGIIGLVALLYTLLLSSNEGARSWSSLKAIGDLHGFYGVLTIGVGILIISGGIDLSIGSVVGLGGVGFLVLMNNGIHPYAAVPIVMVCGTMIGLLHGLLVTRLKLQPFLVTLCGLFMYRGLAKYMTARDVGITGILKGTSDTPARPEFEESINQLKYCLIGKWEEKSIFPAQFVVMLVIALVLGLILHKTIYGRYLYAIGANEQAAKYAGIRTNRMKLFAYALCSTLAAFGGILYSLDIPSVSAASAGDKYELYAITGAVIGGCSLRGGEGTVIGIVLGTTVLPLLSKLITFWELPDAIEYAIIGLSLLLGTIADEFFRKRSRSKS